MELVIADNFMYSYEMESKLWAYVPATDIKIRLKIINDLLIRTDYA